MACNLQVTNGIDPYDVNLDRTRYISGVNLIIIPKSHELGLIRQQLIISKSLVCQFFRKQLGDKIKYNTKCKSKFGMMLTPTSYPGKCTTVVLLHMA